LNPKPYSNLFLLCWGALAQLSLGKIDEVCLLQPFIPYNLHPSSFSVSDMSWRHFWNSKLKAKAKDCKQTVSWPALGRQSGLIAGVFA
jgi:hypothetical protein